MKDTSIYPRRRSTTSSTTDNPDINHRIVISFVLVELNKHVTTAYLLTIRNRQNWWPNLQGSTWGKHKITTFTDRPSPQARGPALPGGATTTAKVAAVARSWSHWPRAIGWPWIDPPPPGVGCSSKRYWGRFTFTV